ncbi:RPM1-interacting protein 4-like [Senna tora]|uniref:RPM1-interacting protein 4-like n=1 Tax=Senna tora TaxID=362788 RepID=A0A834WFZ0_9FABA|nr:RPM1-interacting protein 4-like [Senna tora]
MKTWSRQIPYIVQEDKGRPLPKFGEWDVNNPASAEGFTVIFSKARDEKKGGAGTAGGGNGPANNNNNASRPDDVPDAQMGWH